MVNVRSYRFTFGTRDIRPDGNRRVAVVVALRGEHVRRCRPKIANDAGKHPYAIWAVDVYGCRAAGRLFFYEQLFVSADVSGNGTILLGNDRRIVQFTFARVRNRNLGAYVSIKNYSPKERRREYAGPTVRTKTRCPSYIYTYVY